MRAPPGATSRGAGRTACLLTLVALSCRPTTTPVDPTQIAREEIFEVDDLHRLTTRADAGAFEVALAPLDDEHAVVAWYDNALDPQRRRGRVVLRTVAASGEPAGPEIELTDGTQRCLQPEVDAFAGDVLASFWCFDPEGTALATVGRWSRAGRPIWRRELGAGRNPVVRADKRRHRVFVAWLRDSESDNSAALHGGWFDDAGTMIGPALALGMAGRDVWNVNAAVDADGTALVTWSALRDTRAVENFLARVGRADKGDRGLEVEISALTSDDGRESAYPDVAIGPAIDSEDETIAFTWVDHRHGNPEVMLQIGTDEAIATRVTADAGDSIGAYLAWSGDRLAIAWSDNGFGSGPGISTSEHEIWFATFDGRGQRLGPLRRITRNPTDSLIPNIAALGEGFLLAWNEIEPGRRSAHSPETRSQVWAVRVPP